MKLPRSKLQDLGFDNLQIELLRSVRSKADLQLSPQGHYFHQLIQQLAI